MPLYVQQTTASELFFSYLVNDDAYFQHLIQNINYQDKPKWA